MINCTSLSTVVAGTPDLARGVSTGTGIAIEAILTFFLVFVFYGSMIDSRRPKIGGLAIGLTVALDILVADRFTGAAVNPARVFGPAFACGHWNNHMVYWIGPLLGGLLAGIVYGRFLIHAETPIETAQSAAAKTATSTATVP
jgi:glycerol uptake facilitator-like aquaporin